jgi:hypothetical protein
MKITKREIKMFGDGKGKIDIIRLMAYRFYKDYEKTVDKKWRSLLWK